MADTQTEVSGAQHSDDQLSGAQACAWVYQAKKTALVEFLKVYNERSTDTVLKFFTIDELRKVVVKIHKSSTAKDTVELALEKETQSTDEHDIKSQISELSQKNSDISSDISGNSADTMEKEGWEFNHKKDDWDSYIERLELYFEMKEIKDGKKVAHLLCKVGMDTYKLIRELCAPTKPKEKSYDEIVKLIQKHLNPQRSEAMERCKFQQAKQAQTESIAQFIARLKELSLHCKFDKLEDALRDQLVIGVQDHDTRVALFSEAELTW